MDYSGTPYGKTGQMELDGTIYCLQFYIFAFVFVFSFFSSYVSVVMTFSGHLLR